MASGEQKNYQHPVSDDKNGPSWSTHCGRNSTKQILNLLAYNLLLIIAQFGNVSVFRGLWNIIDAFVWPANVHMSRLICQFVGMFYIFLLYSGTSLHGGVVYETDRLNDGVLMPNFFLSYLLAKKEESGKSDDVMEAEDDDATDVDVEKNNNFEKFEKFETFESFDNFASGEIFVQT